MRLVLLVLLAAPLWGQDTGAVEGVVVNSVTGVGLSGVTVRLNFKSDHYETVTDDAGTFHFSGIKPGDYIAAAEKSSFTVPPSQAFRRAPVHVSSGKEPVRLRFELQPPATLRGRVFGIDGQPAAHAKVDLSGGQILTANDDGSFEFENVEPGSYKLVARPSASPRWMEDGVQMEIRPTYFPSVLDPSAAQQIQVQPATDQGGYDIRLQAAPVYRVRGVVLDPAGKPSVKAVVQVRAKTASSGGRGFFAIPAGPFAIVSDLAPSGPLRAVEAFAEPIVTGPDGSFEFPSLPAGDWILRAESDTVRDEARPRDVMLYGSEQVRLGRGDVDDVQIQLLSSFDLPVSFELSDGSPPPETLSFQVALIPQDGASPEVISRPQSGARNGPARIENVQPGQYLIQGRMSFDRPYYVARELLASADVTGQVVQLSPASPPIRVILKPAATVRGAVDKGEGAAVILWPQSSLVGDEGKSALCGAGGTFEMRGLPPGDYYAVAVDRYDPREMSTASYLRSIISRATRVRLEEGATASLDLNLTR